ncbi:hypothetical protein ACQ4LE_011104 [Meloidogyne hapla]
MEANLPLSNDTTTQTSLILNTNQLDELTNQSKILSIDDLSINKILEKLKTIKTEPHAFDKLQTVIQNNGLFGFVLNQMVNCSSNISLDFKNLNIYSTEPSTNFDPYSKSHKFAGMVTTEELTKALEQNNKLIKLNKKFLVNATGELKENLLVEKTRLDEQKNQLFYLYQELINKDQNRIIDFQNSMQQNN